MTQNGIVVALKKDKAVVQVKRSGMCGGNCASCKMCNVPEGRVEALNEPGATLGQAVRIEMADKAILKTAFLTYLLPAVFLVVLLLALTMLPFSTVQKGFLLLAAVLVYFPYLRLMNRHFHAESRIIEILEQEDKR